jgi:hypothetical protein
MSGENAHSEMVSALLQDASQHVIMPSAVPKLNQIGCGPTHNTLATSDVLLFPNMKIELTGRFSFMQRSNPNGKRCLDSATKRRVYRWL